MTITVERKMTPPRTAKRISTPGVASHDACQYPLAIDHGKSFGISELTSHQAENVTDRPQLRTILGGYSYIVRGNGKRTVGAKRADRARLPGLFAVWTAHDRTIVL